MYALTISCFINEPRSRENQSSRFQTRFNTNRAVRTAPEIAIGMKFQIYEVHVDRFTTYVMKTKVLISCVVTAQLIILCLPGSLCFRICKKAGFLMTGLNGTFVSDYKS